MGNWCSGSVVSPGVCCRWFGGSRAPGVRLAHSDVHGYGSGRVWLVAALLLVLAGWAAVWAVGVGCGYVAPPPGLVRSQGLAVTGCGSGWSPVGASAGLGGFDGCGLGFSAVWRSSARWRVRWRPSASGSLGVFLAGLGVAPRGGGWLGIGVRWWRRWPGGQAHIFQPVMGHVLQGLDCADSYIDDIIIGSSGDTEEELLANHDCDVRAVLDRVRKEELVASISKTDFFVPSVEFCGHVLVNGTRRPAPGKMFPLERWEKADNVPQLRGFLGLANYYSGYVQNYASIATPLIEMLKNSPKHKNGKKIGLTWNASANEAFLKPKRAIREIVPPNQPIVIRTLSSPRTLVIERRGRPYNMKVPMVLFAPLPFSPVNCQAAD